jgi:hypothetical protein
MVVALSELNAPRSVRPGESGGRGALCSICEVISPRPLVLRMASTVASREASCWRRGSTGTGSRAGSRTVGCAACTTVSTWLATQLRRREGTTWRRCWRRGRCGTESSCRRAPDAVVSWRTTAARGLRRDGGAPSSPGGRGAPRDVAKCARCLDPRRHPDHDRPADRAGPCGRQRTQGAGAPVSRGVGASRLWSAQHRGVHRAQPDEEGARKLRRALGAEVTLSALEDGFLDLLDAHGLPRPRTNIDRHGDRVDCHWPDRDLTVELLSYRYHATRHAFEQDVARRRRSSPPRLHLRRRL